METIPPGVVHIFLFVWRA